MNDDTARAAHLFILPEVAALVTLWSVLVAGILGYTTAFTSYPLALRLGAIAFLTLEWAIPLGVFLDLRRRTDDPDLWWVHAAAMPVVNLLGVLAYLEDRRRRTDG